MATTALNAKTTTNKVPNITNNSSLSLHKLILLDTQSKNLFDPPMSNNNDT